MLPFAIATLSAVAALPGALLHSLDLDEVASARIVTQSSFSDVIMAVRHTESTPPMWYAITWALGRADHALTGGSAVFPVERLRLLSVVCSAVAVALTTKEAKRFLPSAPAAFAGTLLALGTTPLSYAAELRAYGVVLLLAVLFALLLAKNMSNPSPMKLLGLGFVVCAGTLTHYFFFFLVAAAFVWLALEALWGANSVLPIALAIAAGTLGFAIWIPAFLHQLGNGRFSWIGAFDATRVAVLPGSLFFGADGALFGLARLGVLAAVVAGCVAVSRRPMGRMLIALGVFPIVAAGAVWALGSPIFTERNLLVAAPFLALLAAAGTSMLPKGAITPTAMIGTAAALAGAAAVQLTLGRVDSRELSRALVRQGWTGGQDSIVVAAERPRDLTVPIGWYLPGHPVLVRLPPDRAACRVAYAIFSGARGVRWFRESNAHILAVQRFVSYDHPVIGRPDGTIQVARIAPLADMAQGVYGVPKASRDC